MAIDLAALKAKLAAQKALTNKENISNENPALVVTSNTSTVGSDVAVVEISNTDSAVVQGVAVIESPTQPNFSLTETLGTAKTSEIDHIDFLSKMNKLQESIHTKHPTMPVLLMQIHKQLRADPELVTTLSEEAIGVIVKGLQIHTKTELVSVVVKESKTKAKKIAVSVDMF